MSKSVSGLREAYRYRFGFGPANPTRSLNFPLRKGEDKTSSS